MQQRAKKKSDKADPAAWCRTLFEKMVDDGLWAIPRTGLILRKLESLNALVLVGTIPPEPELSEWIIVPGMPEQQIVAELRTVEMNTLRDQFRKARIAIEVGPVKEYASFDAAKEDQKNIVLRGLS